MSKKRARFYGRFSSVGQKEESIEQQFEACQAYAEREGYEVTGSYADKALTGKNADKRVQFMRMMRDAERGLFDVLLVWKMDRFARNREDSAIFKGILKKCGVKVISVMEYIPEGAEGILLESMLDGYAEYFSYNLAENVRRGLSDAAKAAKFTGGSVPYGYKKGDDLRLVIDEERAPIVREIFERYANGEPQKDIYDSLNARGFVTLKGKPFSRGSIISILRNAKYKGLFTYRVNEYETITVEDGCPSIVSPELWERVQSKRRPDGISRWSRARKSPLTIKTRCAYCDAPFYSVTGTRQNGQNYKYYRHRFEDKDRLCKGLNYVPQELLEEIAIDQIRATVLNKDLIDEIAKMAVELQDEERADDTAHLESELEHVKTSLSNIYDAVEAGMFSADLQERFERLEKRRKALLAELENKGVYEDERLTEDEIKSFLYGFADGDFEDPDFRAEVLRQFVRRIELANDSAKVFLNYAANDEGQTHLLFGNRAKTQLQNTTQEKGLEIAVTLPGQLSAR